MGFEFSTKAGYQKYFSKAHDLFRGSVRDFVKKEIIPHVEQWEEDGGFPMKLYQKAGEVGILGVGLPEEYGGTPGDIFFPIACIEEIARSGSIGMVAGLSIHVLGLKPIINLGTPEQKKRFITPVLSGDRMAGLAITEPGGGSDVAGLATTAIRQGDHYIINGAKTFITAGTRAGQITCAVRTGEKGTSGISLLVIESDSPGYSVSDKLKKMGWLTSDTSEIYFDNCRVPVENLLGEENKGFYGIMENFQYERLQLAVMANMCAQMALEESIRYSKERKAFGKTLAGFQVTRHKLVDMAMLVEVSREYTYRVAAKIDAGENMVKDISMAKNFACSVSDRVTNDAVQIFGGYGYMRGYMVERLYRDNRILSIGGGTSEIMKEIISKYIF